jgi:hypothetical protein
MMPEVRGSTLKRISLASMMLAVVMISMTAYFVRVGIDLGRRGFSLGEIATVIGETVAVDAVAAGAVIWYLRRRRSASQTSPGVPPSPNSR